MTATGGMTWRVAAAGLPAQPQAEAQLPLIRIRRRHYQEVRVADIRIRVAEVRCVRDVGSFGPKFQFESLTNREAAEKCQICTDRPGPAQNIAAGRPETDTCRRRECRRIEERMACPDAAHLFDVQLEQIGGLRI